MAKLTVLLFALLFASLSLGFEAPRKQLNGAPSEFAGRKLPTPDTAGITERAAYLTILMTQAENGALSAQQTLLVDSSELFAFSFYSPISSQLQLALTDPDGNAVDLSQYANPGVWPVGTGETFPTTTYIFNSPKVGAWSLSITSTSSFSDRELASMSRLLTSPNYTAAVILFNQSPFSLTSSLSTYNLEVGANVGLMSHIVDESDGTKRRVSGEVVTTAKMAVYLPDGEYESVSMTDDGLNGDIAANDGIYTGQIQATIPGKYLAFAVFNGVTSDGTAFVRTTEHILNVVEDKITLTGTATIVPDNKNNDRATVYLGVTELNSNKYNAYAEVWGKSKTTGEDVPVCWISGMVNPQTYDNAPAVALGMDLNWVVKANAVAPFTLKNAYLQESDTFVPLTEQSQIKPFHKGTIVKAINRLYKKTPSTENMEITERMKKGPRPSHLLRENIAQDTGYIVLAHGYCSDQNPWKAYSSGDFTNALYFLDQSANRPTDTFANLIAEFGQNYTRWSGIGHSQGGLAFLHLYNYYWTGLDGADASKRLIQSVGSPYLGCSGAGSAANLINLFGYGCGANDDLTTDGARLWLSGIAADSKPDVHYYTTTYKLGTFFGDSCNTAVNLVLDWPNDGTTELDSAQLDGAVNMGNTQKWCHTTDMNYPAQYTDHSRNAIMNADASR